MSFALIVVLIIGCIAEETYGCSCFFDHPQNEFCKTEFVIRAKAISVQKQSQPPQILPGPGAAPPNPLTIDFDTTIYTVKIIESFKGPFEIGDEVTLYTPESSASCGVDLNTTQKLQYLLTGYHRQGKYRINSCQWNSLWATLHKCHKQRLGSKDNSYLLSSRSVDLYRNNCKPSSCKIKLCSSQNENECNSSNDSCTFTFKEAMRTSICARSGRGYYGKKKACEWRKCLLNDV